MTDHTDDLEAVALYAAKWRQPWMDDGWLTHWATLDHSRCTQYSDGMIELGTDVYHALPGWLKCRSMHCPDCDKPTGGQGHMSCPERKAKKWARNFVTTDVDHEFKVLEDENGDIFWGYGHVDPEEFLIELNRWIVHTMGEDEAIYTDPELFPSKVEHLWCTYNDDNEERFKVIKNHKGPLPIELRPDAFPVTRLIL